MRKYTDEFPFIVKSHVSSKHAFCKLCRRDILISHGGRSDIIKHSKTNVHLRMMELNSQVGKSQSSILSFGSKKKDDTSAIRAECLFTAFYLEHNIPLVAADHMGKLLRAAFPDSEEVKQFHSGRTKTSCIVKEMAAETIRSVVEDLKKVPFSVATDGSHTSDAKLYPLVLTYPDNSAKCIKSQLISIPTLNGPSSGFNIGDIILSELRCHSIPMDNCISMSSDNAPVMLGQKNGVIAKLRETQPHLFAIGCPCHLINLAAQHAARELPVPVDDLLVDVFYYLEASVNRKQQLEEFQDLIGIETQRILRHVCTRWLSLGQCLPRFNRQWPALKMFFDEETNDAKPTLTHKEMPPLLKSFTIPKKTSDKPIAPSASGNSSSVKSKWANGNLSSKSTNNSTSKPTKSASTSMKKNSKKRENESDIAPSAKKCKTEDVPTATTKITRPQKILDSLNCKMTQAISCFMQFSVTNFEKTNVILQTNKPLIHKLKDIIETFLKQQMGAFIKPSAFSTELKYIKYKDTSLHKNLDDISIGSSTHKILSTMCEQEKTVFFFHVKAYYIKSCDYILAKFPLNSEVLLHAQIADVSKRDSLGFGSLRFFFSKFPVLVLKSDSESLDDATNSLEMEFNEYVSMTLTEDDRKMESDQFWFSLADRLNGDGTFKFRKRTHIKLGLLSIPHSNAECERIFSSVRKNKTDFRGSLSNDMLSALLVQKSKTSAPCYNSEFSTSFLKKAKAATKEAVSKE